MDRLVLPLVCIAKAEDSRHVLEANHVPGAGEVDGFHSSVFGDKIFE
jgi:hypothetical protein